MAVLLALLDQWTGGHFSTAHWPLMLMALCGFSPCHSYNNPGHHSLWGTETIVAQLEEGGTSSCLTALVKSLLPSHGR